MSALRLLQPLNSIVAVYLVPSARVLKDFTDCRDNRFSSQDLEPPSELSVSLLHQACRSPLAIMSNPPPAVVSSEEGRLYYYGLPSRPILVARTSSAVWVSPGDTRLYMGERSISPVGPHPLLHLNWEDRIAPEIHSLLGDKDVQWTSLDVVRIGYTHEANTPVILWIGVLPNSISAQDGRAIVMQCLEILHAHNIADVEVEMRESVVVPLAVGPAPKLPALDSTSYALGASVLLDPFTTSPNFPISAFKSSSHQGTGGFFVTDLDDPGRILLVTARHAIFSPEEDDGTLYRHTEGSERPPCLVQLFADDAFERHKEFLQEMIQKYRGFIDIQSSSIKRFDGRTDQAAIEARRYCEHDVGNARRMLSELDAISKFVETFGEGDRVLGHVVLSPPIGYNIGPQGYTEDWAVIEMFPAKISAGNYRGNAIVLQKAAFDNLIWPARLSRQMHPYDATHPKCFDYSLIDNLLRLGGTITDGELRHPTSLDENREQCRTVLKRGAASALTVGRANSIFSYVRRVQGDGKTLSRASKEWAIVGGVGEIYEFATNGDSGAVVVDGRGRVGGLVTGGNREQKGDITYATPACFILERMHALGLRVHVA
ncbi:unnamed protein product [Peniophora sp. CBMAI 1063]|nr:unnamed protein product [Peniophora sp. CBMAI 1063]